MFPEGRIFEFVIVGVIALIVVGPKDLPVLMRRLGRVIAQMRSMAAEFRASFDELARQSELDELRREVESLRTGHSLQAAAGLGPDSGVQDVLDEIHSGLASGQVAARSPMQAAAPFEEDGAPSEVGAPAALASVEPAVVPPTEDPPPARTAP